MLTYASVESPEVSLFIPVNSPKKSAKLHLTSSAFIVQNEPNKYKETNKSTLGEFLQDLNKKV